ncbi:MAG: retron Ec67 family RNA-directed DNA polymerase/endonuclease [Rhizobiales bacterium]|nr:retron Ec67 family RNA-directed DNA polymerase/endonuclease [Hyphomicrobiales bacterium]
MSYLSKLKAAQSRKELAEILGYSAQSLTAIVYQTPDTSKYTTFEIPKRSGGTRTIKAPIPKLKKLQTHLSHALYQSLDEIENGREARPLSFGFRKGRSISENASCHKRRRWVLNLDLEDFFPSFNFGRVRGFFLKDSSFGLHPEVATTIAQIACDGVSLPQGSPCSPIISELIGHVLDMRLVRLAKKYKVTYSRYADDITFSTSQKDFPAGIALPDPANSANWMLSEELLSKISNSGFSVNQSKTRMHFRGSRQSVTGLVVNEKVNIRSEYYRNARSMCFSLFANGVYYKKNAATGEREPTDNPNPLEGMLSHIYYVTQSSEKREIQEQRINPRASRKLYRRFLFYKYFLRLDRPLIVTEGKTDPIYLKEAIERLDAFHPALGQKRNGQFHHTARYFNYKGTAHEILDLGGGGTANLKSIPIDYRRNLMPYKKEPRAISHRPMLHPVILLVDNDDGLGALASTVKEMFGTNISLKTTNSYYHIVENLFLVKTPENNEKKTCIEDMFPLSVLKRELNGKKFNPSNQIDITKEYSKDIFANHVVKAEADTIDFSGFTPLLDRIKKVIEDYKISHG